MHRSAGDGGVGGGGGGGGGDVGGGGGGGGGGGDAVPDLSTYTLPDSRAQPLPPAKPTCSMTMMLPSPPSCASNGGNSKVESPYRPWWTP